MTFKGVESSDTNLINNLWHRVRTKMSRILESLYGQDRNEEVSRLFNVNPIATMADIISLRLLTAEQEGLLVDIFKNRFKFDLIFPVAETVHRPALSIEEQSSLLDTLKNRFENNNQRYPKLHPQVLWENVFSKLEASLEKLWSLNEMEKSGGEPDVIHYDKDKDRYIFIDCSAESPEGRRNICYNLTGQKDAEVKGYHPVGNVEDLAGKMGVKILNDDMYFELQRRGRFDRKSFSFTKTETKMAGVGIARYGAGTFPLGVRVHVCSGRKPYKRGGFRSYVII